MLEKSSNYEYYKVIDLIRACTNPKNSAEEANKIIWTSIGTQKNGSIGGIIPIWFVIQLLINASGDELPLPHESANWSVGEYVHWFNMHSDRDRLKFFASLMHSYKQSVISSGATEFVRYYPVITEILENNIWRHVP